MDLSPLHVHLMLNHMPLLGTIAAALLLGWGLVRRSAEVTRLDLVAAVLVTGALAVLALWLGRRAPAPSPVLSGVVCAALAVSFGLFAWVALVGGQIRHTELRSSSAPSSRNTTP
jgi:hypothetical protein